ncbi:MAG TPA: hypothetical protein PK089_09530 [Methanoregulaceae archaeon]|nr:hypothetical protein [Methanoregulaceae archaeon]
METRLLDLAIGVVALVLMIILIVGLPFVLPAGPAYLTAIALFLVIMSGAGYIINQRMA